MCVRARKRKAENMKKMLIGAAVLVSLALETWIARRSDTSESPATTPSPAGSIQHHGERTASPSSSSDRRSEVEESSVARAPEPVCSAERAASTESPIERETMLHRLTTAIEESLSGGLDPEAILSAGLALVKL